MRTIFYGEYLLVVLIELASIFELPWIRIPAEYLEFVILPSSESIFFLLF